MRPFTERTQRVAPRARRERPEAAAVVADEEAASVDRGARRDLRAEGARPAQAMRAEVERVQPAVPGAEVVDAVAARSATTRSASRPTSPSAHGPSRGRARSRGRPSCGRRAREPTTAGDDAICPCGVSCRHSTLPVRIEIARIVARALPMYATPLSTTAGNSIRPPSPRLQTMRNGGRSRMCVCVCARVARRAVHRPLELRPVDANRHLAARRESPPTRCACRSRARRRSRRGLAGAGRRSRRRRLRRCARCAPRGGRPRGARAGCGRRRRR